MNKQPFYHVIISNNFEFTEKERVVIMEELQKLPEVLKDTVIDYFDEVLFTATEDLSQEVEKSMRDNGILCIVDAEAGDPSDLM